MGIKSFKTSHLWSKKYADVHEKDKRTRCRSTALWLWL